MTVPQCRAHSLPGARRKCGPRSQGLTPCTPGVPPPRTRLCPGPHVRTVGEPRGRPRCPRDTGPTQGNGTARAGARVRQGARPSPRVRSAARESLAGVGGGGRPLLPGPAEKGGPAGGSRTPGPSVEGLPSARPGSQRGRHGQALSTFCSVNGPQHTLLSPLSARGVGSTPRHPQAWPQKRQRGLWTGRPARFTSLP